MDTSNPVNKSAMIFKGNNYRITILSDILVRLEYSEKGIFEDRPTEFATNRDFELTPCGIQQDEKFLVVSTKYFKLQYSKEKKFNTSKIAPESTLRINLLNSDKYWYYTHPEARNFKSTGKSLDSKEKYIKGLYSTDGFVSIDDSNSMIIKEDGTLEKRESQNIDIYVFMYRRDFGLCLKDYFKLTGKPPLIPRYSLGIWWNRNEAYKEEEIKKLISDFNRNEIPMSVLLLGPKWQGNYYYFNTDLIKNPKELMSYLHERGICIGAYMNPNKNIIGENGTTLPFNVFDKKIVDFYFNMIISNLNNLGIDFYWNDYDKSDLELRVLNYYYFKFYEKDINRRGVTLSRNSLMTPHKYPIHYSGETVVSWNTLKELPYFNSSASNLGLSWWSHDIGGYKEGIEDWELYIRYVELGTFSPIFRFSADQGHYYKREPWRWDVRTLNIVRHYTQLRQRLIPYLYTEAYRYYKTGLPLVQPLYYSHPEMYDEPIYKNLYLFGSEFLVSPITTKKDKVMNRAVQRIYLPEGTWYDFKTGKKFPGNKRYITFFKDEDYPVYARSGAIIPLSILGKNRNITNSPESLEIHIFPGKSNSYKLYEDDGYTSLYKTGYYLITDIDYNYQVNNYTLIIRPVEGKTGIIPGRRNYKIRFRNTKQADDVIVYEQDSEINSNYYVDDQDFIVEVNDVDTTNQLSINCKGKDIEIDAIRIINEDVDSIISDLEIETKLKEKIAEIIFGDLELKKKRIKIRKLKKEGLSSLFIRMFLKLLDYEAEI